ALFRGHADAAWEKLVRVSGQLGGVERISLQMTNPRLAHADLLRGIELLGTEVVPRGAPPACPAPPGGAAWSGSPRGWSPGWPPRRDGRAPPPPYGRVMISRT